MTTIIMTTQSLRYIRDTCDRAETRSLSLSSADWSFIMRWAWIVGNFVEQISNYGRFFIGPGRTRNLCYWPTVIK